MDDPLFCKDFEGYGIEYHKQSYSLNMTGFHSHRMLEISFLYSGTGKVHVAELEIDLRPNVVYILRPNILHRFRTDPDILYDRTVFYISTEHFAEFFKRYTFDMLTSVFEPADALMHMVELTREAFCRVVELTDEIVRLGMTVTTPRSLPEMKMTVLMFELLVIIGSAYLDEGCPAPPKNSRRQRIVLSDIINYVNSNICERITVETIAEYYHFNRNHLSRFFGAQMGMPLSKFIAERKIAAAKHLLTTTALPITDIGHKLGFCDTSHFYRAFKTVVGVPPKQFRDASNDAQYLPAKNCNVYF